MNNLTTYNRLRNGLITAQDFKITSLEIAEMLGQRHDDVLRAVRRRLETPAHYAGVKYLDKKGEERPMYLLTEEGFMLFIMESKKAGREARLRCIRVLSEIKGKYETEKNRQIGRKEMRELTRPNNDIYKAKLIEQGRTPQGYDYSNKENLIMRKTTGYSCTAIKRFLEEELIYTPKKIIVRDFVKGFVLVDLKSNNLYFTNLVKDGYNYRDIKEIMRIKTATKPISYFIDEKHELKSNLNRLNK